VTSEREIIERSLYEVMLFLKVRNSDNWTQSLYQYANRLAHLYLLRELNGIPAFLVFAYFVDDQEMHGPTTVRELGHFSCSLVAVLCELEQASQHLLISLVTKKAT